MVLYESQEDVIGQTVFVNVVQHPQLPLVKPLRGTQEFKLSDIYRIVMAHIKKAIV
jgi:hypothetical protein